MPDVDSASAPASRPAPWLRAVLSASVVVTLASALALAGALASYFLQASWSVLPALYALSLFGLPLGFTLLVLYVVLAAVVRSRT